MKYIKPIVLALTATITLATLFANEFGGFDWQYYYRFVAAGEPQKGYVPYYAVYVLAPFSFLPLAYQWPALTLVSLVIFFFVAYRVNENPLAVFGVLGLGLIGEIWQGQVDFMVAGGLYLVLKGQNVWLKSLGLLLALAKPQLSFLVVLFILIEECQSSTLTGQSRTFALLKLLAIPGLAFVISVVQFGFWPIEWLGRTSAMALHSWNIAPRLLWPYSLVALPLPFLLYYQEKTLSLNVVKASLAASALLPNFSVYSHILLYLFEPRLAVLSWLALPAFWVGGQSGLMTVEMLIPISLLIFTVRPVFSYPLRLIVFTVNDHLRLIYSNLR